LSFHPSPSYHLIINPMYKALFEEFLASSDTLRVYAGDTPVFTSEKERLLPLMEYLAGGVSHQPVTIFDKIMGNAAALLSVRADCREVYSPLGSEIAVRTLEKYGIAHHITKIVPFIRRADGQGMCPMEKLSLGKDPREFYQEMLARSRPNAPAK
jgi:hypothetical protein